MPAATTTEPSNIRAFVHWNRPTIYAGEEIECVITFKNVARSLGRAGRARDRVKTAEHGGLRESRRASYAQSIVVPSRKASVSTNVSSSVRNVAQTPLAKGHRPTLSLNVVSASSRSIPHNAIANPSPAAGSRSGKHHGRTLSIISIGGESPAEVRSPPSAGLGRKPGGHVRSASLQHVPRAGLPPSSPAVAFSSPRQPSPLYETISPTSTPEPTPNQLPIRPARRRPGIVSAGNTPQIARRPSLKHQKSEESSGSVFKFPADSSNADSSALSNVEMPKPARTPNNMHSSHARHFQPRPTSEQWGQSAANNLNPLTRVMSETSTEGTPRSSSEIYTMSNASDETLTSEAPSHLHAGRWGLKGTSLGGGQHSRQASRSPQTRPADQEILMMAYASTRGHFTLDGSLVNAAPFEEVKRKGVQGGGGVVGVERSKRSSGIFGSFGWGNFGESLGGLLGGDEMSSMAQMKASAGTKEIPLLSTPQSLLFVDLKLAPGESRSYSYRFTLPHGLPPTYRGRSIKVAYCLSLGVQRPEGQAMRHVEIPFRVLGSYDSRGETLSHDLMQPYVLLQDAARTLTIAPELSPSSSSWPPFPSQLDPKRPVKPPAQGFEDFLRYTERLLEMSNDPNNSSNALLSPTSPSAQNLPVSRQGSIADLAPATAREAIDFAIMRANIINNNQYRAAAANPNSAGGRTPQSSANRFNIARAGQPISILTLLRPAFRLGEAVTGILDFTIPNDPSAVNTAAATYSLLIELESFEEIDPSLAIRSGTSVTRLSRKVHAAMRENVLYARRVAFHLAVPAAASPSFLTTGVSLKWRLRVEFTTQRAASVGGANQQQRPQAQQQTPSGLGLGIHDHGKDNRSSIPPRASPVFGQQHGSFPGTPKSPLRDDQSLLEVLGSDERGTTFLARENLLADSFEIAVPLRIYGAIGIDVGAVETEPLEV